MEPVSDEDLIAEYRTRAGSHEAQSLWNELFRRHQARVALWCLRLTGDREAAADLAQEVFLKAFRYLDSYRGESKFSTWLYSITRNHCFNEIKSRAAKPEDTGEAVLVELADTSPDALSQLERRDSAELEYFRRFTRLVQRERWYADREVGDLLDDSRLEFRVKTFRAICGARILPSEEPFTFELDQNTSDLQPGSLNQDGDFWRRELTHQGFAETGGDI